ncbi:MAG: DNA repair protein RadA, partial [Acidimicrobiales bacterium]
MTRARAVHLCSHCGTGWPQWAGRCGNCGEWNTLSEEPVAAPLVSTRSRAAQLAARSSGRSRGVGGESTPGAASGVLAPISAVDMARWAPMSSGIDELDRVLGGGFVPGSVTLVGGEPGVGKSTLLLQALGSVAARGQITLLVTAEESEGQVRMRSDRIGVTSDKLMILAETDIVAILQAMGSLHPALVVIDSIQTVVDPDLGGGPGTLAQVRECTTHLVRAAKTSGTSTVLVGHVTKEGTLAGPRALEHSVDTVLSFEGERHYALRLLRATKHRFGATGELGLFEMAQEGLKGVPDPSVMLLGDRRPLHPGGVVLPTMEGQRPLLVEIQALVTESGIPIPRRSAQGLDAGRLALILAVLDKWMSLGLANSDVFASVVGGVRITEPAGDLALALALCSAVSAVALPEGLVAFGEVGLGGELRQVTHAQRRLSEAARLGFDTAVVPSRSPDGPPGLKLVRLDSVAAAAGYFGLDKPTLTPP